MPDPGAGLMPCDAAVIQAVRVSPTPRGIRPHNGPSSGAPPATPPPPPPGHNSGSTRKHQRWNRSGTKCGSSCARGSKAESMVPLGGGSHTWLFTPIINRQTNTCLNSKCSSVQPLAGTCGTFWSYLIGLNDSFCRCFCSVCHWVIKCVFTESHPLHKFCHGEEWGISLWSLKAKYRNTREGLEIHQKKEEEY